MIPGWWRRQRFRRQLRDVQPLDLSWLDEKPGTRRIPPFNPGGHWADSDRYGPNLPGRQSYGAGYRPGWNWRDEP